MKEGGKAVASSRDMAVFTLRKAAELLAKGDFEVVMPEWDEEALTDEERGARTAALAIANGGQVEIQDLGHLAQYIADMLED
jgi:hypothetical protein